MKKRLISICLALLCVFAPASAAFSDITDSSLAQKVAILDALGIMQGMGDNQFNPDGSLTRAQFCKIAVTAMGISDVSAYASYTIFPDVKHTHWAAGYINAAVRHPDLKERSIIRGYVDGTFGPDKTVNYGEVCTMLLRMLGYTEEDVGPFWPADYIAKAQAVGLTEGVSVTDAKSAVKRSDAAILLLNTLNAPLKDDAGATLMDNLASVTVDGGILLATSGTDSSLAANEALFFEDGAAGAVTRRTAGALDSSMIGVRGTLVLKSNAVAGIIPTQDRTESYTVTAVSESGIQTSTQTIRPGSDDKLFVSRAGHSVGTFSELWSDIQAGDTLTMYYDGLGSLVLMAVLSGSSPAAGNSFVFGVEDSAEIPQDYTILKNGTAVNREQLQKYDVVTLDADSRQALVSDAKLSGQYSAASPSASDPETVTVCGQSYSVSKRAASSFAGLELKDYITLLFNAAGEVVAAYPKSSVNADMKGIVTDVQEDRVTVSLVNGLTMRNMQVSASDLSGLLGRVVTVGQSSNGSVFLTRSSFSGKLEGSWSVADAKLGSASVSTDVQLYVQDGDDGAVAAARVSDVSLDVVPESEILYTEQDGTGTVILIVAGPDVING